MGWGAVGVVLLGGVRCSRWSMGLTVLSSGAVPQTLQALPPHGVSLLFLAHELGLRVLKRKRLRNRVEELEQRYSEYLHLLASDTQVRPGA